jgi:hypothetical protein
MLNFIATVFFGIGLGWIGYRTLKRTDSSAVSGIATAIRALAAAVGLALTACNQNADLDAIKQLASTTQASADSYSALANDYYVSCTRRYEWEWAAALSYRGIQPLSVACQSDKLTSTQWEDANLVLLSYVAALGALAGGGDSQTDYGIPKLIDSINSASGSLSSSIVSTISSLGQSLVTDLINMRRRDEIATYAPKANKDLDQLIGVLEDVGKTNYTKQLTLESDGLNHFFQLGISEQRSTRAPSQLSEEQVSLRDRYRSARQQLDAHSDGVGAYVNSLEAIKNTHSALVASVESNSTADVGKIIQFYVDQLAPDIQELNRSVKGGSQ